MSIATKPVTAALAGLALAVLPLLAPRAAEPAAPAAEPPAAEAPAAKEMSEKEKDIRKLLDMTGAGQLGKQLMDQMLAQFKQAMPRVPEKFWDEVAKETSVEQLVEMVVPVYDGNFEHEDIKGLIAFYESPLGKKLIAAQPQIMKESMAAGQKWGMEVAARIVKRLQAEGYR